MPSLPKKYLSCYQHPYEVKLSSPELSGADKSIQLLKQTQFSILRYAAPSWFPFIGKNQKKAKYCLRLILQNNEQYKHRLNELNISELIAYMSLLRLHYVQNFVYTKAILLVSTYANPQFSGTIANWFVLSTVTRRSLFHKYSFSSWHDFVTLHALTTKSNIYDM